MANKNPQVSIAFQDVLLKGPQGPKVLGQILDNCNFLNVAKDNTEQVEQDHMKLILSWCGIGFGMTGEQFVRALMAKKLENLEEESEEE